LHRYGGFPGAVAAVAKADKLGAHLKKCIPDWMEEYGDSLVPDSEETEVQV
jgi:hypothetical protein